MTLRFKRPLELSIQRALHSPPQLPLPLPSPQLYQLQEPPKPILKGKGKILISGLSVYGQETKFLEEVRLPCWLIVRHPQSLEREKLRIKMMGSQVSMVLQESRFELSSYSEYWLQQESKRVQFDLNKEYEQKLESLACKKKIGKVVQFRKKKNKVSYERGRLEFGEEEDQPLQRALEFRTKNFRDKHC